MGIYNRQSGFTIIEVMLFLAVSAALAMAIFVGSSVAIGNQRYRDALNSFQSLIQQQYNEVANVVNTRDDAEICVGSSAPRGASNCYIVGKAMVISGGKNIAVSNVRGEISASAEQALKNSSSDLVALGEYSYTIDTPTTETSELAWGASLVNASDPVTILILRSPLSGTTRTFTYQGSILSDEGVIRKDFRPGEPTISGDRMTEATLCLDQSGFTTAPQLGVVIRANASGASGIELTTDTGGCNATT